MKRRTTKEEIDLLHRRNATTDEVIGLMRGHFGQGMPINLVGIFTLFDAGLGTEKIFEVLKSVEYGRQLGVEIF